MKNIILLFICMISFSVYSQRIAKSMFNFSTNDQKEGYSYHTVTGAATDVLLNAGDTIDIPFYLNKRGGILYDARINVAPITSTDTVVIYRMYGKKFEDQAWTQISTANSSVVSAAVDLLITSVSARTYYRYLMIRLIILGSDSVGTGVKLNEAELKIYDD